MVRFSLCNENGIVAFLLHQYPDLTSLTSLLTSLSSLTALDIIFDSRESLHFAITLPENGRVFEKAENAMLCFAITLRSFARNCAFL